MFVTQRLGSLDIATHCKGPVALYTVAFIYLIEEHPKNLPILQPGFRAIDAGVRSRRYTRQDARLRRSRFV